MYPGFLEDIAYVFDLIAGDEAGFGCDQPPCMRDSISTEEEAALDVINERIESGEIIEQKAWKFIRELNSYSKASLDAVAIVDGKKEYTYRQMFRLWKRYARVFSGLDITGRSGSRVGMTGTPSVEASAAFYALNMTGTSVSMIHRLDLRDDRHFRLMVEKEGITDLVLTDVTADGSLVKHFTEIKDEIGIRNIIILRVPACGRYVTDEDIKGVRERRRAYKSIEGVLMMNDLLDKFKEEPIVYADTACDDTAVILHTSGTTSGIHKPIPLSDRGLNEAVSRLLRDEQFSALRRWGVMCQNMDYSGSYSMIDMLHLPLAFGGKAITIPYGGFGIQFVKALLFEGVNVVFGVPRMFDIMSKIPFRMDLSALKLVFLGGAYISAEAKKNIDAFLKRNYADIKASIGYGLSEAGGACILASPDRKDDAIGYPLPGVKVKICDEDSGKFYDLSDGPRTGVLYISTPSLSCGRIGDNVFFENEIIDGEEYLNTYDLVKVGEDGALKYAGRMNKYFVNNDGIRFDAGLIETALSRQPEIKACALAPEYDKNLHDSIPVLYVETAAKGKKEAEAVRQALRNVFIGEGIITETNLPAMCMITDDIPYNDTGKVDVYSIISGSTSGKKYIVEPVRSDGKLTDIKLPPFTEAPGQQPGMPDEIEEEFGDAMKIRSRIHKKEIASTERNR